MKISIIFLFLFYMKIIIMKLYFILKMSVL